MSIIYILVRVFMFFVQVGLYTATKYYEYSYAKIAAKSKQLASGIMKINVSDIEEASLCERIGRRAVEQYELGQVIKERDKVLNKYLSWQDCSDKLKSFRDSVSKYVGRTIPYIAGKIDSLVTCTLAEYYGCGPLTIFFTLTDLLDKFNITDWM